MLVDAILVRKLYRVVAGGRWGGVCTVRVDSRSGCSGGAGFPTVGSGGEIARRGRLRLVAVVADPLPRPPVRV